MINVEELIEYSKRLTLLYVEDNSEARNGTVLILEEFFKNIVIAVDGADGLQKFQENSIDIVLTDINMPHMNGIDMIEKIREIDRFIPILVLSAYSEADYFMDSISLGVEGYLLKPIKIEQFQAHLEKTVNNIKLKRENEAYKQLLELKVQEQVDDLREKDKLLLQQAKMAAMGEMIDVIAHQWKQPLNAISIKSSFLELFASDDGSISRESLKACQVEIADQIKHLIKTIDEFRTFFRNDAQVRAVNLKSTLELIELLLKDTLEKNQIQIQLECEASITLHIAENDIKHLILNLINNAIDEMIEQDIETQKRIITIKCSLDDESVIIRVKDNGSGIADDIIDKIFAFNFTTKSESGGTGVGLYLCKMITDKYHGMIEAFNDNGAVFKVTFKK